MNVCATSEDCVVFVCLFCYSSLMLIYVICDLNTTAVTEH